MRSDARRNRESLLEMATELILAEGGEVSLDAIARRAGVGIGTLYRHFSSREILLTEVALYAIDSAVEAGHKAIEETPDGYAALRQYMHSAVRAGVGVLNLVYPLLDQPDWGKERKRASAPLDTMIELSKRQRLIRDDVQAADVVFAVIRFSRPVEVGMARDEERALAHRHLDIYIDGLRRER